MKMNHYLINLSTYVFAWHERHFPWINLGQLKPNVLLVNVLVDRKQSCNEDSSEIMGGLCKGSIMEGEGHLILDPWFLVTFGVNNMQIYMALCGQLVLGGLLNTGSRSSVVDD